MNETVKVALVGCGAVSQLYYTPALQELEKNELLQVKALFDPNPDSVAQLNQSFPAATTIKDLAEISTNNIDLAIISSPPRFHAEQTIKLLKSGISVLCEKPMADTVAEAEAMIEAASESSGILAIGLFRRFFPATQTIHQILSRNMLGEVTSFYFSEGGYFQWPVQSPAYFQKSTAGGGVLLDIGVHLLDLTIWWMGEPVEVIYEDDAMGGIDVNCRIQCKFERGFTGEVRLSRDCDLPNRYVIRGTKGWLCWDVNEADKIQMGVEGSRFAINVQLHEIDTQNIFPKLGQPSFNFEQSFASQICNVVAAMRGKESLIVPGEEGIRSLRTIESCYRHRNLMSMPWLGEAELTRAQQLSSGG